MIGQHIGNYQIVRRLGVGAVGTVYEAVDERIEHRVAIKVVEPEYAGDPEMVDRLRNEARAVNLINNPGVVRIMGMGRLPDGGPYLVMEHLDGETLRSRLDHSCGGPVPGALRIGRQIASALQAAHDKGIVHRDLKPENVMLVPDPEMAGGERVKVLDFGLADIGEVYDSRRRKGQKRAGGRCAVVGTPLYMAPEQCSGQGSVDGKADVYSLGVVLYEMLGGQPPFQSAWGSEVMLQHLSQRPVPLRDLCPSVQPQVETLVSEMLAKDPEDRPTMSEVAERLQQLDRSVPSRQTPLGAAVHFLSHMWTRPLQAASRNYWAVLLLTCAMTLLLGPQAS